MKNKTKMQKLHIAIIIIGTIFISLGAFHSNIWFDESYTVGMVERTFYEIWTIGGNDVHPVLYYWILKIVSLVANAWGATSIATKIMIYRIFSIIPLSILGVLGYTHIKKDFGEKTGMIFSFLVFFLPESAIFANEIRMYSLAILFVTVLAIYAYRLRLIENSNRKNWLIFFIASITSIFLHYYGLMAAGIINVILLGYLIKNKRGKDILAICTFGLIQLISYLPWIIYLVGQLKHVSKGFWITFTFPETLIEILAGQFIGNLNIYIGFIVAFILYIYLTIKIFKYKGNKMSAILGIAIYLLVIIAAVIMTLFLNTSILVYRYLFVITGLYIFTISFILGKEENNKIILAICSIIAVLGTASNIKLIQSAYSENNFKQIEYLQDNIQAGDQIVYKEQQEGSTIAVYFTENKQYFYNPDDWGVKEAYKAFGSHFETCINTDFIEKLEGRIWLIDKIDRPLYNELFNDGNYKIISEKQFNTEYHKYSMNIILIEKAK